ncbi:MAG: hypothetical protein AABM29_08930 [Actinomycetota bacterium]
MGSLFGRAGDSLFGRVGIVSLGLVGGFVVLAFALVASLATQGWPLSPAGSRNGADQVLEIDGAPSAPPAARLSGPSASSPAEVTSSALPTLVSGPLQAPPGGREGSNGSPGGKGGKGGGPGGPGGPNSVPATVDPISPSAGTVGTSVEPSPGPQPPPTPGPQPQTPQPAAPPGTAPDDANGTDKPPKPHKPSKPDKPPKPDKSPKPVSPLPKADDDAPAVLPAAAGKGKSKNKKHGK